MSPSSLTHSVHRQVFIKSTALQFPTTLHLRVWLTDLYAAICHSLPPHYVRESTKQKKKAALLIKCLLPMHTIYIQTNHNIFRDDAEEIEIRHRNNNAMGVSHGRWCISSISWMLRNALPRYRVSGERVIYMKRRGFTPMSQTWLPFCRTRFLRKRVQQFVGSDKIIRF